MSNFDISRSDYRDMHDKSLLPGLKHDHFRSQKTRWVSQIISETNPATLLDFGFGPGDLLEDLLGFGRSNAPLLFGVEPSQHLREEFIKKHYHSGITERLYPSLDEVPDQSIEMMTCFNVLHHIPVRDRASVAATIYKKLAPSGVLLVWEHNPYNLGTQWIVCRCPYDNDAVLLSQNETLALFTPLRLSVSQYVNVVPPQFCDWQVFKLVESSLAKLPIGAQYRLHFKKEL